MPTPLKKAQAKLMPDLHGDLSAEFCLHQGMQYTRTISYILWCLVFRQLAVFRVWCLLTVQKVRVQCRFTMILSSHFLSATSLFHCGSSEGMLTVDSRRTLHYLVFLVNKENQQQSVVDSGKLGMIPSSWLIDREQTLFILQIYSIQSTIDSLSIFQFIHVRDTRTLPLSVHGKVGVFSLDRIWSTDSIFGIGAYFSSYRSFAGSHCQLLGC